MAEELALAPADGVRVVWDQEAIGEAGTWRLEGSLEPGFSALRVVSGKAGDGTAMVLCAARPDGARHHDEELVAAAVIGADGDLSEISEALVSTEYGADGAIRRLGLELYMPNRDYPVRAAGDAKAASATQADGERRRRAELDFRLDGSAGNAVYEIVERT